MIKKTSGYWLVLPLFLALLSTSCKTTPPEQVNVAELLDRVEEATRAAKTMEADFIYTVDSVKQKQEVKGTIRMMKPNYARLTFTSMRRPAYPNLVASDGTTRYSYTSHSFDPKNPLAEPPASFHPVSEAKFASGLAAGGGVISTNVAEPNGSNLRLWDAAPIQAFYGAKSAIRNYLYVRDLNQFKYEGTEKIDGVRYHVLYRYFPHGNIAGGESTHFDQRLYIGPDNLIHMYVMEFRSGGKPGKQVARLRNIKINRPMKASDFAFTPPK
ncbi:MAG: LolA family protein [Limisphaerales bacterium]